MSTAPILFVTGKGGTGKTTVAISVSTAMARRGERVLLVEPYGQTGAQSYFGDTGIAHAPTEVADNLSAVRLQPRQLLEDYFRKLLKLPALARRLLSSSSFNAVTSAAPGVSEFLALDRLDAWSHEAHFDRIVVDGPATGHALQLLRSPFQLAAIASGSPLQRPLQRLTRVLRRKDRVDVALVSICEEMSIAESIEAHDVVRDQLGISVVRPVLNRCAERRFTRDDVREIDSLDTQHPFVHSARLQISAQKRAAEFGVVLKKNFGVGALALRDMGEAPDLNALGATLVRGWKL